MVSNEKGRRVLFPEGIDPSGRSLCDYWQKIKGAELVPNRSALRPSELVQLLPNLLIFEYRESGKLICRLAGTSLVEKWGIELTGTDLLDFYDKNLRAPAGKVFDMLRRQPCGLCVRQKLLSKHNSPFIAELIFLPLRGHDHQISQLIAIAIVLEHEESRGSTPKALLSRPVTFDFFDIGAGLPSSLSAAKHLTAMG